MHPSDPPSYASLPGEGGPSALNFLHVEVFRKDELIQDSKVDDRPGAAILFQNKK